MYSYCYDSNINGACDTIWHTTGTARQVQLSGLNYATQYEWQVMAENLNGRVYANCGVPWTFTTAAAPPASFNKIAPADRATGVAANPTLTWQTSAFTTEYTYCYDSIINNLCDTNWNTTGMTNQAQLINLSSETRYEWQVRAINAEGTTYANGSETAYRTFTTRVIKILNLYLPMIFN